MWAHECIERWFPFSSFFAWISISGSRIVSDHCYSCFWFRCRRRRRRCRCRRRRWQSCFCSFVYYKCLYRLKARKYPWILAQCLVRCIACLLRCYQHPYTIDSIRRTDERTWHTIILSCSIFLINFSIDFFGQKLSAHFFRIVFCEYLAFAIGKCVDAI